MNPLSDEALLALLDDLESDRVERKEAWAGSAPDKARQAVCAFANDLPNHGQPGVLIIELVAEAIQLGINAVVDQASFRE